MDGANDEIQMTDNKDQKPANNANGRENSVRRKSFALIRVRSPESAQPRKLSGLRRNQLLSSGTTASAEGVGLGEAAVSESPSALVLASV
jgi:hypothetical protein